MTTGNDPVVGIDELWVKACEGEVRDFAGWMGRVERPIRRSLARFAAVVDAESIVQETLLRMWKFRLEGGQSLAGENASLRWALSIARNLALNEARKTKRHEELLRGADFEEVAPAREPDLLFMKRVRECAEKLTGRLATAFLARLSDGGRWPDSFLARRANMTRNTFLQNVTRARRQVVECLEKAGVRREELIR